MLDRDQSRLPTTLLTLGAVLVSVVCADAAVACSLAQTGRLVINNALMDTTPPSTPTAQLEVTRRGSPGGPGSCLNLGAFSISVSGATDDTTPSEELGYMVRPADPERWQRELGTVHGLEAPILATDGVIYFHWFDGATEEQEAIMLELHVHAVDKAGNESLEFATLMLSDPGRSAREAAQDGCSVAAGSGFSWGAALFGVMLGVRKRR